jgi:predicted small integral membrane protein
MKWMAWSSTSAAFFIGIGLILLCMTIAEIKWPCVERRGFLPIATTRGDRVFIALLSSAFLHLGFLAFGNLSLLIPIGVSALWFAVLLRWG